MPGPFKWKLFDQNQKIAAGHGGTPSEAAEDMARRAAELEGEWARWRAAERARKMREIDTRRGG